VLNKRVRRVHTESSRLAPNIDVARSTSVPAQVVSPYERTNRLKPRSAAMLDALRQLDVTTDQHAYTEIMTWVRSEYDARQGGTIMGLFAKCHLGPPYVDHRLDLLGHICEHFAPGDAVPMPYAQARGLAQSGAYAHIELYSDGAMIPIGFDGRAVELS
jgi:hypothetical protein